MRSADAGPCARFASNAGRTAVEPAVVRNSELQRPLSAVRRWRDTMGSFLGAHPLARLALVVVAAGLVSMFARVCWWCNVSARR
jgi:hypothetical protein